MASADLREELECTICLSVYTDPVNLKCGHNFCRGCIDCVLDMQERSGCFSCPECRKEFQKRPELQQNITLRNIVENFLPVKPAQKGTGDVFTTGVVCTYCVDFPVPAVKSCLLCEASLCDKHLKVHSKSPEHILCDPTSNPESRKCSIHKKILEYYCTEDAVHVCVSCYVIGEHKGHQMESLEEAFEKKKKKMRKDLQTLATKIKEVEERVQSLQKCQSRAQKQADGETEKVSSLFKDLRRRLDNLEKGVQGKISKQAEQVSILYSDVIRQLEIKKDELSKKMRHIEELCKMTNPMTVLQEPDTGDLCDTEEGDKEARERHDKQLQDAGDLDVDLISQTLHTGLSDIMSDINGSIYIPEAANISLDLSTANNDLFISRDRKTASRSSNQDRPETPERFQYAYQVLSSQSFSSGRHYFDVDIGGSGSCRVGVCYPSMERKGDQSQIGYNKMSCCLERHYDYYSVIFDKLKKRLPHNITSNVIRVYLNSGAGQISFYDLCHPMRHLHTFNATFTEPLHAVLWVRSGYVRICGVQRMDQERRQVTYQEREKRLAILTQQNEAEGTF
ncbi:E3 ubiquitin/ISG15 ligase TRIM25-like [Hyperolius riggenbachi]|uniref:E3 ubiquitin/ISG15 ligase TRIM25-like n=1 Tax=Hyperolius riggenbachi TaxID=752182 RepID=UPI0035A29360